MNLTKRILLILLLEISVLAGTESFHLAPKTSIAKIGQEKQMSRRQVLAWTGAIFASILSMTSLEACAPVLSNTPMSHKASLYEPGTIEYVKFYAPQVVEAWEGQGVKGFPSRSELEQLSIKDKVLRIYHWIKVNHIYPDENKLSELGELDSKDVMEKKLMHCYRSVEEMLGLYATMGLDNQVVVIDVTQESDGSSAVSQQKIKISGPDGKETEIINVIGHSALLFLDTERSRIRGVSVLDATHHRTWKETGKEDLSYEPDYKRIGVYRSSIGMLEYMSLSEFREKTAKGEITLSDLSPREANAKALNFLNVHQQGKDGIVSAINRQIANMNKSGASEIEMTEIREEVKKRKNYLESQLSYYERGDELKKEVLLGSLHSVDTSLMEFYGKWAVYGAFVEKDPGKALSRFKEGKAIADKLRGQKGLQKLHKEALDRFEAKSEFYGLFLESGTSSIVSLSAEAGKAMDRKDYQRAMDLTEKALKKMAEMAEQGKVLKSEADNFNRFFNELIVKRIVAVANVINPKASGAIAKLEEHYQSLKTLPYPLSLSDSSKKQIEAVIASLKGVKVKQDSAQGIVDQAQSAYDTAISAYKAAIAKINSGGTPDLGEVLEKVKRAKIKCFEVEKLQSGAATDLLTDLDKIQKQISELQKKFQSFFDPLSNRSDRYALLAS